MTGEQRLISWIHPCSTSNVTLNMRISAHRRLMGHPNWAGCDESVSILQTLWATILVLQTLWATILDNLLIKCVGFIFFMHYIAKKQLVKSLCGNFLLRITQYIGDTHNTRTRIPMNTRTQILPLEASSKTVPANPASLSTGTSPTTESVGDSPRGPLEQRGNPHLKPATTH
jgi:hypothetical protein